MAATDMALTWFSITSSAVYLSTVAGQVRRYGISAWRELGYGTGKTVEEIRQLEHEEAEVKADHLI